MTKYDFTFAHREEGFDEHIEYSIRGYSNLLEDIVNLSKYFVTSIFPIFILSGTYIFILYKSYLSSYDFINNFTLYLSIDHLSDLFKDKSYLMIFWTHFIAINLFTGGWIVKDSQKFSINRILLTIPLIITYLIGPIGLLFYWFLRIFYAKNVNLYD